MRLRALPLRLTAALGLGLFVVAAAPAGAQAPPASPAPMPGPGFVPPYEIMRTVRDAGFDPLGPPLREGTIYVLRATDYRGILMRVVIDARTGAIRDANRIVPGPGNFGPPEGELGMAPPPYGPPPGMPPPYARPAHADMPLPPISPVGPPPPSHPLMPPVGTSTTRAPAPPLPRARPEFAARKPAETKPAATDPPPANTDAKPAVALDPKPAPAIDPKPDASKSDPAAVTTPTAPAKPKPPSTLNIAN